MLQFLKVKNFGIIGNVEIEFGDSCNIITGETGAGKSLLIGAIRIVTGERFTRNLIKQNTSQSSVTACFSSPFPNEIIKICDDNGITVENEIIIRRTSDINKKTRNYINDIPVTLQFIDKLTSYLIDMHGQFEHQSLLYNDYQLSYIDNFAGNNKEYRNYFNQYENINKIRSEIEKLKSLNSLSETEIEWKNFQLTELKKINMTDIEYNDIIDRINIHKKSGELFSEFSSLSAYLHENDSSVIGNLSSAVLKLKKYESVAKVITENIEKLETAVQLLQDFNFSIKNFIESSEVNEIDIDDLQEKLFTIQNILRKNKCSTIEDAVDLRKNIISELENITHSEKLIKKFESKLQTELNILKKYGKKLTDSRIKTSKTVEKKTEDKLKKLNMADARFKIEIVTSDNEYNSTGYDKIRFLVSTNKNDSFKPLKDILSGGELARIMLALKSINAEKDNIPTLIFDEIDTGISGKTASKVSRELGNISQFRQVMSVTHQPAIAAIPGCHFRITKSKVNKKTNVTITALTQEERIQEIASLMSGGKITETNLKSAEELIIRK